MMIRSRVIRERGISKIFSFSFDLIAGFLSETGFFLFKPEAVFKEEKKVSPQIFGDASADYR
jgi:hypothetical protein